ncbi:MAG TPA: hypothetical protein PLZ86_06920 [bacterium]|nr:hypothetical protein [bacterium]
MESETITPLMQKYLDQFNALFREILESPLLTKGDKLLLTIYIYRDSREYADPSRKSSPKARAMLEKIHKEFDEIEERVRREWTSN